MAAVYFTVAVFISTPPRPKAEERIFS